MATIESSSSNPKKRPASAGLASQLQSSPSQPKPQQQHQQEQQEQQVQQEEENPHKKIKITKPNIYQACASLLDVKGRDINLPNAYSKPAAPDEILANVLDPPPEIPTVDEKILKQLPDSDLLKSLHYYAGKFYKQKKWGNIANKTMDESAMLTMGVLLEEMVRYQVGKNGDLAFAEEEDGEWEDVDEDDEENEGDEEDEEEDEEDEDAEDLDDDAVARQIVSQLGGRSSS